MNAKEYRKFYQEKIREDNDKLRDIDFIGCYYRNKNNSLLKKGFFELYHGDKEDERGFLTSQVEIAEDGQAIYEFIQNAVDANSSHFYIFWDETNFLVINNGTKFKDTEIKSILNFSQSTKSENPKNTIGKFGIGFKLIHRLVGIDNGLDEIINEYKGPLLFSWDKNYIKSFLNKDLKAIDKEWFFKILYTNFPCGLEEKIKDKKYLDRVPFKREEYVDLVNFINKQKINLDYLEEGTIFFLKLGKGKSELLNNELDNLRNGIKYSLNIIKSFSKNRAKRLNDININGLAIKPENLDTIKKDNYIFLSPINQEDSLLLFDKNNNEKISFFKFFPMGDQRNALNFILHSDKFDIESNRRKLHETPRNKELLTDISNSLKDEFNKIKNDDIGRYRNILLNLYLSDLETANHDKLIQEYLTSHLYQYIQSNIPTKDNEIIKDKNLVKIIDTKLDISLKKHSEFYFNDETIIREAKKKLGIKKWNVFDVLIYDDIENWVQKLNDQDYQQFLFELNNKYKNSPTINDKVIFPFGKTYLSINHIPKNYFFRGTFDNNTEEILEKLGFIFSNNNMAIYKKLLRLNKKPINASMFTNLYTSDEIISILEIFEKHSIKNFAILEIDKKYQISSQVSHTYIKDEQFKAFIKEDNYEKNLDIYLIPELFQEKIIRLTKILPDDKMIKEKLIREKEHQTIIDFIIKEDDILKSLFMNSLDFIGLEVDRKYRRSDYEHKVIQFFIENKRINELKSKIYIDGEGIDKKLISPLITFKYGEVTLKNLGPKYKSFTIDENIPKIAYNFEDIDSSLLKKKIFNFRELNKEDVYEKDIKSFLEDGDKTYKKTVRRGVLEFLIYLSIERNSKKYLKNIKKLDFNYSKIFRLLENILILDKDIKVNYPFSISDFFPNIANEYYIKEKDYALDKEKLPDEVIKKSKILETYKKFGLKINDSLLKIRKQLTNQDEISNDEIKKLSNSELLSNLDFLKLDNKSYPLDMKSIEIKNIKSIYRYLSENRPIHILPILKNKGNFIFDSISSESKYYITRKELNNKNKYFQKRLKKEIKEKKVVYFEIFNRDEILIHWIRIRENEEERNKEARDNTQKELNEINNRMANTSEYNIRRANIGRKGELLVKGILIDKFGIDRVIDNNENGENKKIDFEILNRNLDAITHKIEVKATVNRIDDASTESVEFYMSKTQYSKAQEYSRDTHLIFVTGVESDNPQFLYMNFDNNWLDDFETLDKDTSGLIWQKETVKNKMTWEDAMEYAKNLRLGGYDDWRLPTIKEFSKVIRSCGGTTTSLNYGLNDISDANMNNDYYQNSYKEEGFNSDSYWSSSANKNNSNNFGIVRFNYGYINYDHKKHKSFVRCVREG